MKQELTDEGRNRQFNNSQRLISLSVTMDELGKRSTGNRNFKQQYKPL